MRLPVSPSGEGENGVYRVACQGGGLLHWLRESPEFSLFMMKSLCEKLLYNSDRLTRISLLSMRERFLLSIYTYEQSGRLPA